MFPAGMTADKWQKSHMTFLTGMGSIANVFTLIPADLIKSDHIKFMKIIFGHRMHLIFLDCDRLFLWSEYFTMECKVY